MTQPEPARQPDASDTKRRILNAATAEFADHGFAGARVDRIASEAAANKQLIYRYFGSKQDLYEAVFADMVTRARGAEPNDSESTGASIFRAMLGDAPEQGELTSQMVRTLSWEGLAAHVSGAEVTQERRRNYAQATDWVRGEQAAGRLRNDVLPEHIVALAVSAGGAPYSMPNVFHFIFERDVDARDHEEWRAFILRVMRP